MSTTDARVSALISTLEQQRNAALNTVAALQAEVAVRDQKIKELEAENAKLKQVEAS